MSSHPFRIGFVQVNLVIVEYTGRLQNFSKKKKNLVYTNLEPQNQAGPPSKRSAMVFFYHNFRLFERERDRERERERERELAFNSH